MRFRNTPSSYAWPAQLLHWSVAALIVTQFVLAKLAERADDNEAKLAQLALLANHKSVGITILGLALLRVCWRFISPPPALPTAMPGWQIWASKLSHAVLYVLLFLLPISGWLMSSASAYTVSWFGLFELPDLVAPSKALKELLIDAHHLLGKALFIIALLHIAAALKHHFVDKDDILKRMISYASFTVFAVLLTSTLWSFATVDTNKRAAVETPSMPKAVVEEPQAGLPEAVADEPQVIVPEAVAEKPQEIVSTAAVEESTEKADENRLYAWDIDYEASSIEFTAEQAGAKFSGVWPAWRAEMFFDADALTQSKFDVRIDVSKVDTRDEERDVTLEEPEWFYSQKFPEAKFLTGEFKKNSDGTFMAASTLTIKGFGAPVKFNFSVEESAEKKILTGNARLDRLSLKVGTGEWTDLENVGQYVDVKVRVEASLSGAQQ